MRPKLRAVVLITVLALLGAFALAAAAGSTDTQQAAAEPLACDWNPGDAHKMHYPQLPNPAGWDVIATDPIILADDWQCSESGPVRDIHFWGSWKDGLVGTLNGFRIQIWSDIPAASSPTGYSMPGVPLWQRFIAIADIEVVEFDPGVLEGWYDPTIPEILPGNNPLYYQYNICLSDPADWFIQDVGTIYWLVISTMPETPGTFWGWKSSTDHFNDDAVWWDNINGIWQELYEPDDPTQSMDLSFVITNSGGTTTPTGACCYDGPVGPLCIETTQDSCLTFYFGTYMGDGTTCSAATEACCFQDGSCLDLDPLCCQLFGGTPQGAGTICLGDNDGDSIDDACQPPALRGACCYEDLATGQPFCSETTQDSCLTVYFGTYMGDGTTCSAATEACCFQDGSCQDLDPLCCQLFGGTPMGPGTMCSLTTRACCFPDGSCQNLDPLCCTAIGGTPQPIGVVCLGDGNGNMIDDACENPAPRGACCFDGPAGPICTETTQDSCENVLFGIYGGDGSTCSPPEACCFQGGFCQMLDPLCCELIGGIPQGPGTVCSDPIACCLPDGSCEMLDPLCCTASGGTPQPGLTCVGELWACCLPDGSCQELDPACCQALEGAPQVGTHCTGTTEACCLQDGSCLDVDPLCCQLFGGTPQGAGTVCLGDLDGNNIDDACESTLRGACCFQEVPDGGPLCIETTQDSCTNVYFGTYLGDGTTCGTPEACCLQDGTCQMLDPLCCELVGGIPEPGLTCLGEVWACCIPGADCQNLDPACCQAFGGTPVVGQLCTGTIEACCFQDGTCQNLDPVCCIRFGGTPQGAGSVCLGDADGNNIDDACEQTPHGACCFDGPVGPMCVETTQDSCISVYFGTYLGDGTTCLPPQACCFQDGTCLTIDPFCCELYGGTPLGTGTSCSNPEACCLPDGTCQMLDPFCCEVVGGVPQPGVDCFGEVWACCIPGADCQNLDPACCQAFGGTSFVGQLCTGTIEACCFSDGTCQNLDPVCCEAFGGIPQGAGSVCLGDLDGNNIDDACEQPPGEGACCLQTSCFITTEADCIAAGGTYFGDGTVCGIDANGNGIPDICESWNPGDDHKMHYPQLPDETGWDVKSFAPHVVADDWQCTQTGPVSDIHFWGSWLHGLTGNILGFWISIHADIPASQSPTGHSMPGALLWLQFFPYYNAIPIDTDTLEGWYDPSVPPTGVAIPFDHAQYYQYNIFVPPDLWFYQKEGTIYWLNISAVLEDTVLTQWGWKSSIDHFNDDATWGTNGGLCPVPDDGTGTADLPGDCPYTPETDTAIIITGGLPAGTTIEADPVLQNPGNIQKMPGGNLGGEIEIFTEILQMELNGTGGLATFHRNIAIPVQVEVHTAPRTPGEPVQQFETDMVRLQGEIFGDPDFDLLRVTAGTGNGLPSPGHTTLTRTPSGNWNVDSFFDIEYRIDFQGAPGSALEGFEGTTQGTIRLRQGGEKVPAWNELYEPPFFDVSMDMAFVITGDFLCDCTPGDANDDGLINITDAVYMINYIFGGGSAPMPYATCSGDANCDCIANITDAVYLIIYIFAGGPPPCDCATWLSNCGPPLY